MARNAWALAGACLMLANPAQAHIIGARLGDFYGGAAHPLTGLEDIVLWLALGVLAGMQPPSRARWLVLLFPACLLAGLGLGLASPGLVVPGWVDAALMVAVGGLVALAARLPGAAVYGVAALVAVARGLANASGVAGDTNVMLFAAGFAVAGYAVLTLAAGATAAFRAPGVGWRTVALRAAGSWVAAVGLMVGGLALRGT